MIINKKDLLSLVTQVYKKNVKSKKKFVLRPVLYFFDDDDDENWNLQIDFYNYQSWTSIVKHAILQYLFLSQKNII